MVMEYSKLGDEDNARKTIDKLVIDYNDFPKKAETFWKLGQYYREDAKMYDQAAELYEYAARTSPKDESGRKCFYKSLLAHLTGKWYP